MKNSKMKLGHKARSRLVKKDDKGQVYEVLEKEYKRKKDGNFEKVQEDKFEGDDAVKRAKEDY